MSLPVNAIHGILHPDIVPYLSELAGRDDPLLDRMEAYSAGRGFPLVGRESGRWLELLTRAIGGRRVIELGSGFGYSAFFFARAVGEGGLVIGSEKDANELQAHRGLYEGHPLASRIDIRQGSAFDVLDQADGSFDVVFVDVDKVGYPRALELAVPRLRLGGLLLVDNVLWGGRVARPLEPGDVSTESVQTFNRLFFGHPQLAAAILPCGDGLGVGLRVA